MKKYLLTTVVVAVASLVWLSKSNNNVCKTFEDYYSHRDSNENCYHNPDVKLSVPEIVQRNGYPIETYEVVTSDGYILGIFRIPHGKHSTLGKPGRPVLLQHGAHSNCGCFINMGKKSLAFILADEGYDVWLGNLRGSKYSLNHLNLNHTTDLEYWNFSIDEHGIYDLPAEINFVRSVTNKKIVYIGYSMGTTAMYMYSSKYPEKATENIELFINIAPAAYLGEVFFTAPKLASFVWDFLEPILRITSNGIIPSPYVVPIEILHYICLPFPFQMRLCTSLHIPILGSSFSYDDPETLPITLVTNCDRSSLKVWSHFAQLWYYQTFAPFDHGEEDNIKRYGSIKPPEYNLSKVQVPMYFIRSNSDLLTTELDTNKLYKALPQDNKPKDVYIVQEEGFGHLNLIVAKNVVALVYNQIISVLKLLP